MRPYTRPMMGIGLEYRSWHEISNILHIYMLCWVGMCLLETMPINGGHCSRVVVYGCLVCIHVCKKHCRLRKIHMQNSKRKVGRNRF